MFEICPKASLALTALDIFAEDLPFFTVSFENAMHDIRWTYMRAKFKLLRSSTEIAIKMPNLSDVPR